MRKTLVYILILGILAYGVWFFLFKDTNLFSEHEAGFTIKDTAAIHKIFMANKRGDTVSLTRTPEGWIVNNQYPASKRMTQTLLETMHDQYAAYPVPESAHNNVIKGLSGSAIKVEVFDKKGDRMRVFYVGGQVYANKGTYMLMEGAHRPYVIQLPAYEGYVTPRYDVDAINWRDRTLLDLKPEQVQSVSVTYLQEREYLNSFSMHRDSNGKMIASAHPDLKLSEEQNDRRVNLYATFFQKIGFEGYLNGTEDIDSIISISDKRCEIDLTTTNGRDQHIDIYWMPVNKRSKNLSTSDPDIPDEYDPDRFYGITNHYKDTIMLQRYTFDKIFRKGYEFFEKD